LWSRVINFERLMWEIKTLRNDTASMILHHGSPSHRLHEDHHVLRSLRPHL
jgi:hypothetical protein